MPAPIALQLYSVREQLAEDYTGVITKIAEMGYVGVEPAGFPGSTMEEARQLYDDLGLQVCSAHMALPVGDGKQKVIDEAGILDCPRVVSGFGPDQFKTRDLVKAACGKFNEAAANVAAAGLSFGIHNHWWEFIDLDDGTPVYKVMLDELDDGVLFELDTYWVQTGGKNAADVVAELGPRAPLLHIKDGPCDKDQPMTAVGDGEMDFPAVIGAAAAAEWLIVEIDRCDGDMIEAVARSYGYLIENELAQGK